MELCRIDGGYFVYAVVSVQAQPEGIAQQKGMLPRGLDP